MEEDVPPVRWQRDDWLAACGAALLVFSLVALASPGRIDIVDGQTRYEVARSLVEHGDFAIRDSRVWFQVFPGRERRPFATYRLPQSVIGVGAIVLSDALGAKSEERRRFFFALTGATAAAALAAVYVAWFRARGLPRRRATTWALLGAAATPIWFYGTSTFDDVLGAATITAAVVFAFLGRGTRRLWPHVAAAFFVALAFHCKQPLAAFVLVVIAAGAGSRLAPSVRRSVVLAMLLLAIATHTAYDRYKFPPQNEAERAALEGLYVPAFPGNPAAGVISLAVSPGKGLIWYCPAVLLGLVGYAVGRRRDRWLALALLASGAAFVGFVSILTFFSGDPAWGPRYLVPLVALLWLGAPEGAARLRGTATTLLITTSVLVQLLALAVDPHRLYVERSLPSAFYFERPWVYFDPAISHLVQRPREILEIATALGRGERAEEFTPAPEPTFAFPVLDFVDRGPAAVERYQVLASFRPFWISQRWLPPEARPVPLGITVAVLAALGAVGVSLLWAGLRRSGVPSAS